MPLFSKALKLSCLIIAVLFMFQGNAHGEDDFAIPANLKDNIAFWKKIYSEVSLYEGLIHDRDYPMIIYRMIRLGDRAGKTRRAYIRENIEAVESLLKRMESKSPDQWTGAELQVAELFKQYASLDELNGAASRVRFQLGQKERFKEGLERASAYMPFILDTFKKYNIPSRIAYLPHVESSFNLNAYSKVGAAGIWQFMRSTARIFKLKIDYQVDERRDPIKATIAAAKLLTNNYNNLQTWPLAITAYNHGPESIKRAIANTGSRDLGVIIDQYQNRRFKFASKNFYGCFIAASDIAANPENYFSDINYQAPIKYNELPLKTRMRPKTLAKQLGISEDQLRTLNPALRPIVFTRQLAIPAGFVLRIPTSMPSQNATEAIAAVPDSEKNTEYNSQQYYTVRKKDTLYKISQKFKVPFEAILEANELSSEDHLSIGQVLRIPTNSPNSQSPSVVSTAARTQVSSTTPNPSNTVNPIKSTNTLTAKAQTQTPPPPIVTNPAITPVASRTTNGTNSNGKTFDAEIYNLDLKVLPGKTKAELTVSVNETLAHYADWLKIPVSQIRRMNPGKNRPKVNQRIVIPIKEENLDQFKNQRIEYHMALEEDFYNQYQVIDTKKRIVKSGETLWSICHNDEQIPLWLLKKYNHDLDLEASNINASLVIPVVTAR